MRAPWIALMIAASAGSAAAQEEPGACGSSWREFMALSLPEEATAETDPDRPWCGEAFPDIGEDTNSIFGAHAGTGIDIPLGSRITLSADLRYIDLAFQGSGDDEFDSVQLGFGLSIDL